MILSFFISDTFPNMDSRWVSQFTLIINESRSGKMLYSSIHSLSSNTLYSVNQIIYFFSINRLTHAIFRIFILKIPPSKMCILLVYFPLNSFDIFQRILENLFFSSILSASSYTFFYRSRWFRLFIILWNMIWLEGLYFIGFNNIFSWNNLSKGVN